MNLSEAYNKGLEKVYHMKNVLQGNFPHITKNGEWLTNTNGHWTGGFWTGLLWLDLISKDYINESEKEEVQNQVLKLSVRMNDNKTHDMGFIFGPSCIMGHNIENNNRLVEMAKAGAQNMVDLFEDQVGLVLAWDEPGYEGVAIVDTIMNAPIMIWTAEEEKNDNLYEKGIRLADTIKKYHIRPDYSIYHMVRWDPTTYNIVEKTTHQGYSDETCWSRGQAWALYGFANMYRYTNKDDYLKTSQKLAEYYWNHVDDDTKLPRWDFYFKNTNDEPIDASASSIAASGMLLLSTMLEQKDAEASSIWRDRAKQIIDSMIENCLYHSINEYGIIEKVTVDKPRNSGINESSMYGDYYFMEALYRYLNRDKITLLY